MPSSWWERYSALGLRGLTSAAREVVEADSRAIVATCFPGPDTPEAWPETRVRTGIAVGAVQSGKTGSMLAIGALLLDAGVDLLVVLAGTRVSLWRQTYERLLQQLDGSTPESAGDRWAARVLVPQPVAILRGDVRAGAQAYMAAAGPQIEQGLRTHRPTILVIPKIDTHLVWAARELEARIVRVASNLTRSLHMVVMDDEADDASVLDANDSKTIPGRIERLWTGTRRDGTSHERLYATYVAYTATPQANFLQQAHNPLAPRSFSAALRAPYRAGPVTGRRSPTFEEPEGITRYYCGGELFYNELRPGSDGAFCRPVTYPVREVGEDEHVHECRVRAAGDRMLVDGLRAYLVAAGCRVLESRAAGKLMPSELGGPLLSSDRGRLPPPCCMLLHPSARQDVHLDEARRLIILSAGKDPDDPANDDLVRPAALQLDVAALRKSLATDDSWARWIESYRATLRAVSAWPGAAELGLQAADRWAELAAVIATEVIPHVRIRIINSDPASDDRPGFEPVDLGDGRIAAPPDVLTIFVSGNVMSRGITIEGLVTSVFTRPASEPAADTQMQMQRWFGYRGKHVHLCRVLLFQDQLDLFRAYHEHDVAMRTEILASMDRQERASPVVLQGPRSLATAKIPTSRLPLHPGPTPSVKLIEADDHEAARANAQILGDVLYEGTWVEIGPKGKPRGRLRTEPVGLPEVAALLDRLRYASYGPGESTDVRIARWKQMEDRHGLLAAERPLFRAPVVAGSIELDPRNCPYAIAAYLRLWAAALKRTRCDGLYPSDSEGTSWSLAQPLLRAPELFIGVAYGEGSVSDWPALKEHGVRTMVRGEATSSPRVLSTLWGRRGEGGRYHGDQLFDYNYNRHLTPPALLSGEPVWRERGHPGLLLFHVIRSAASAHDAVTVGLALPHGGPEQFAALATFGRRTTP